MDSPLIMAGAKSKRNVKVREAARDPPGQDASNQGPAAFDGPPDSETRGRSGSNAGSRARSKSRTASQTRAEQMETAKSLQASNKKEEKMILSKNVDFGANAWNLLTTVSHNVCLIRITMSFLNSMFCVTHPAPFIPAIENIAIARPQRACEAMLRHHANQGGVL
jgi:hypothetical protein